MRPAVQGGVEAAWSHWRARRPWSMSVLRGASRWGFSSGTCAGALVGQGGAAVVGAVHVCRANIVYIDRNINTSLDRAE